MKIKQKLVKVLRSALAAGMLLMVLSLAAPVPSYAATTCGNPGGPQYTPSIDLGCHTKGNPIMDATFGIIRFLSDGVGLVIVGSLIVAGIQFTASQGNPQATAKAVTRVRSTITALIVFIFGYALLNYLLPAGFLK